MSKQILIHKVKITKTGVHIEYDDPAFSGEPDGVARDGKGEARPSLYKAMNALLDEVINVCRLDANGWDGAEVTSVTIKHLEGDMGCVIVAQNKTPEVPTPVNIPTPYLDPSLVSKELRAKLEVVQEEARAYLAGKRAQVSLFDQEEAA